MVKELINNTLAVIVLYNNKINESPTFISLSNALKTCHCKMDLFIYDNSIISQFSINEYYKEWTIQYEHDSKNSGISVAYNKASLYATKKNKQWLLLLDQDTIFPIDIFQKYTIAINDFKTAYLFSPILKLKDKTIFSPCRYFLKRGFVIKKINSGKYSLNKLSPVNSGILVMVSKYLEVGGYNENVFLDFSDFQFIERFRKFNKEFVIIDSVCEHDFSNQTTDLKKLTSRYISYCKSAKNCEKNGLIDHILYLVIVLERAFILTLRTKNLLFLKLFLSNYLSKLDANNSMYPNI